MWFKRLLHWALPRWFRWGLIDEEGRLADYNGTALVYQTEAEARRVLAEGNLYVVAGCNVRLTYHPGRLPDAPTERSVATSGDLQTPGPSGRSLPPERRRPYPRARSGVAPVSLRTER